VSEDAQADRAGRGVTGNPPRDTPAEAIDRRVLMVAHTFAPGGGVAVHRPYGFARHLPDRGWRPTVLAAGAQGAADFDRELVRVTDGRAEVRRAWDPAGLRPRRRPRAAPPAATLEAGGAPVAQGPDAPKPGRSRRLLRTWVLVPDEAVGWLPSAVALALRLPPGERPHAVYSTSGPPTNHLVALLLSSRWQVPWVADFRDPWTEVPNRARREIYESRSRLAVDRALERAVLARADVIVTVSEEQRRTMLALTPGADASKHIVIANGYEPEWVRRGDDPPARFTVVYTGSFYRAGEEPGPLFSTLAGLLDSRALQPEDVRVVIATAQHARVAAEAAARGLGDVVEVTPPLPHEEALALQRSAAVLWLALSEEHGRQGALTAKVFEYMAARRPVLALAPPGSRAGRLLAETGMGVAVHPSDAAGLAAAVVRLHDDFRSGGGTWHASPEAIAPYARPVQAGVLADLLDGLVGLGGKSAAAGGPQRAATGSLAGAAESE